MLFKTLSENSFPVHRHGLENLVNSIRLFQRIKKEFDSNIGQKQGSVWWRKKISSINASLKISISLIKNSDHAFMYVYTLQEKNLIVMLRI